MRQINAAGIELITSVEGFSPTEYDDCGHRAVGYGHDILPGESFNLPMSKEDAIALFTKDVTWREAEVERLTINAGLNDNQFAALVSLFYNIGSSNFVTSTVLRKLNSGDFLGAASAFRMWNKSRNEAGNLVVNQALVDRREREIELFLR